MTRTLFSNVTIIDGSGNEPFPSEVLVEDNRITAVAPPGTTLPRDNSQVIDGHRLVPGDEKPCLMPGLIESHSHFEY